MKTYSVTFKVVKYDDQVATPAMLEAELKDLLNTSVLPALNAHLVPLTFDVKNSRG